MKLQVSIAGVMAVVAAVALNAAVVRILYAYNSEVLVGITLTGLALQWAVFHLVRCRSNRTFRVGFTVFGTLAMASFVWGMHLPSELVAVAAPGRSPRLVNVSQAGAFWLGYGRSVGDILEPWLGHLQLFADPEGIAVVVTRSLIWSAPQLLVALAGGLCALVIAKVGGTRLGFHVGPSRGPLSSRAI